MTEIKGMLYQEKFIERLDTNPYILCCSNGVIDLKNKIFRDGTPEDMCSLSTNTPYLTRDEVNQEYSDEATGLADFFDKLMPFESTRKYLLEHTAGSLIGINSSQTFNNFIGVGANGKSTFISLIEKTIGDYFTTIPSTLVTQKRPNIGGASPEIAGLKGVRYAIIQEPSKGETINEGIMKQLTGETSNKGLTGRFLFQDCISFMPMFSLGVCTNIKYNVKSNDSGTWRRIRLIEFNSVFAHETDEEYDEHNPLCFKKDVNLKMDRLAIPFLSFLVNCVFETQGRITECELITTATKEYRFQQDRVGRFIRDVVVPCNGAKTNKKLISEVCNTWFETNYKYRINNNQLFEELDKKYECLRGSYHGFNIITDNHNENAETKEHAFLKMFNRYFSITDDKTDFIKSVEICEWAKLNNLKVNASKTINIILLNEFNLDSKNKEHYKTKKIDGKPVWCWFGVKKNDAVKDVCDADETTADDGDDSNADTDVEIYEEE
jgi:P4 family phage/plasmid primase-like protien